MSPINNTFLAMAAAAALLYAGCTSIVSADRSQIPDNLYHPTPGTGGSAGSGLGGAGGSEEDAAVGDADNTGDAVTDSGDGGLGPDAGGSDVAGDVSLPDVTPGG